MPYACIHTLYTHSAHPRHSFPASHGALDPLFRTPNMGTPRVVPPSLRRVPHPSPRARRAPSPRRGRRASSDYTGGDSDADGEAEVDADEASAGRTADSELEDEVERVVGLEQDHVSDELRGRVGGADGRAGR